MGVKIEAAYLGDLQCSAMHGPSKDRLSTDAPVDNQGRGEHYSPTDLLATALATCTLTTMAIVAKRHGWELRGARSVVVKEMGAEPVRHVSQLTIEIRMLATLDAEKRALMERTARHCPVAESLNPRTKVEFTFTYVE